MPSIHARVAQARDQLRRAGIADQEADLDARVMAQWLLDWDAARFFTDASEPAPPNFPARYERLVERRARREPMAYLRGLQEFWGLLFDVTPAVLIPRPETELIVEAALDLFSDPAAALHIAEVGTGSGCVAVALACERPNSKVIASDVSADALRVASTNAVRQGVQDRVRLVQCDMLSSASFGPSAFDLLVSNPPYVPEQDQPTLQPEVRDHEPDVALFGGPDGLSVIRRLVPESVARLKENGFLIFEFGMGQAEAVAGLIRSTPGLRMVGFKRDLQGVPRTTIARSSQA